MIFKKFPLRKIQHSFSSVSFGFFFDIDGVFTQGRKIIPAARNAFSLLLDKRGNWKVPCVFVTNAGNKLRKDKAIELSEKFQVNVSADQVVMSHSPLRMFTQFHNKKVLVIGQGPVKEIAKMLGFNKPISITDMKNHYPFLDVCSHTRPKSAPCAFERYNKPIEAIVLFGEPVAWESNLQLILDVLMTNGQPYKTVSSSFSGERLSDVTSNFPYPHISLLACNMDMQWMSEAPIPRIGPGCFLQAVEILYEKLTGRRLLYTALMGKPSELTYHYAEYRLNKVAYDMIGCRSPIKHIYCVGDNPQTDIYGANLYSRYLQDQHTATIAENVNKVRQSASSVSTNSSSSTSIEISDEEQRMYNIVFNHPAPAANSTSNDDNSNPATSTAPIIKAGFAETCESILVLTGVIRDTNLDTKSIIELMSQNNVNHNHRDFPDYPELKAPNHVCHGVDEAIQLVFEKEHFHL